MSGEQLLLLPECGALLRCVSQKQAFFPRAPPLTAGPAPEGAPSPARSLTPCRRFITSTLDFVDLYTHAEVAAGTADEGRRLRELLQPDGHPEGIEDWKERDLGLPTRCATAQHAGECGAAAQPGSRAGVRNLPGLV